MLLYYSSPQKMIKWYKNIVLPSWYNYMEQILYIKKKAISSL